MDGFFSSAPANGGASDSNTSVVARNDFGDGTVTTPKMFLSLLVRRKQN
jgi:hypothetical protein